MGLEKEIAEAVDAARSAGCKELVLLHRTSSYPAPMDQANLRQIAELGRRYDVMPGLSDHTLGTTASVAAVALGACVIEKHFTLSRADKGPDSEFSIEPDELKRLCQDTHDAWQALGQIGYDRQPAEAGSKVFPDPAARRTLESALLDAGMDILGRMSRRWPPLGFAGDRIQDRPLGFGTLAVSFRNCPNNAPLALWWDTQDWIPLFPRRTYAAARPIAPPAPKSFLPPHLRTDDVPSDRRAMSMRS